MSDITVIGLGLMGSALAHALQGAGHALTVWNRTAAKMQPFAERGATAATGVAAAVAASPAVLICVDDYAVSHALLGADDVAPLLAGRTVVQLSTGTPAEARASGDWMRRHGVAYLDGAILGGPGQVGTDAGHVLLCGDEEAHVRTARLLACLGGRVRYLGSNLGLAAALDLAWLCQSYGRFLAIAHAAVICESEQVDFGLYGTLFPDDELVRRYARVIADDDYENPTATLGVWAAALQRIRQQGVDAGVDTDFPDLAARLLEQAIEAGFAGQNVMAMFKVLRRPPRG